MNNFTRTIYGVLAVILSLSFSTTKAQCVITSTDGYTVTISVRPVSVIKPATCPNGYNYNISFLYNVVFSGSNIPSSLYTLQGRLFCNGQDNFFDLPNNGGSGTGNTQSNPWRSTSDCATATPTSLRCTVVEIEIHGPGIPAQKINCAAGILPINLVSFNGRIINNSNVSLNWVTATETNNKTFTVERSTDANNWQAIKTINGAGNSTTTKEYTYTDMGLATGMYYYRLKQTDVSGESTYSNIIAAKITNGATKDISLVYTSNQVQFAGLGNSTEWEVAVISSTGAVVLTNATINASTVSLPNLATGIYFVKLRNKLNNTEKTLKFFKN